MTAARPLTLSRRQVIALQSGPVEVRRKVTPQPSIYHRWDGFITQSTALTHIGMGLWKTSAGFPLRLNPPWKIGTRFWVREALDLWPGSLCYSLGGDPILIRDWEWFENHTDATCKPRDMPRWASRLFPVLTTLRVEQIGGVWYWIGTFSK
jgi:hypothetical protein